MQSLVNPNTSFDIPVEEKTCICLTQSQDPDRDECLRLLGFLDERGINDEVLAAFDYGEIQEHHREMVDSHLKECPACRNRLTDLSIAW